MVSPRPPDVPPLNGHSDHEPDRHYSHGGARMSPLTPLPSYSLNPQRPIRVPPLPSPQRGSERRVPHHQFGALDSPEDGPGYARTAHYSYQTTLTSPTIVSPPTPSTVFEENPHGSWFPPGGAKASKLHVTNGPHLESDPKTPGIGPVRTAGADKDRGADPEGMGMGKSREEAIYADIFEGRGVTSLDLDSVNSRREDTPFSDRSSILVPRGAPSDILSSMVRMAQHRPTNLHSADVPVMLPTRPTSRPRSQSEEESVHCDELNVPPPKPLSKMEKAILRRIEFGQNIDFSRVQLS